MFPAFPPLTLGMLNSPGYSPGSFARVRTVFTVAPPEALRAMQRRMPHSVLVNAYGMTEFGGSVVMVDPADGDDARLATQGPPFPGLEIGIRDEASRPLPAGTQRDRHPRAEHVRGHHKTRSRQPRRSTRAAGTTAVTSAASAPTAGCATRAAQGHAQGGRGERGRPGDRLAPAGHPAVSVAQVVGVADEKYGEVPAAFIELRPGTTLTEEEVIAHCRGGLASFKVPRYVRFVTEWPMSSTKVQTFRLREQLEAELAARIGACEPP